MASKHTLYTCEIVFLRAEHVPIGDLNDFSCDPYIRATLEVPNVHPDHPDPPLVYRTPTVRRNLNPTYNVRWIVSGIPDTGFTLSLRLIDEDPGDHDDRLGKSVLHLPRPETGERISESWDTGDVEYKVEKRRGSIRAYAATYLAAMVKRGVISHHARIWVSVRVLCKASNQNDRRVFTVGPAKYTQHFSPIIGHLVSASTASNKAATKGKGDKSLTTSTFVANRLQLMGPPPPSLRHRYVGYRPLLKALFRNKSIGGRILNYALHRQYHTVYSYDKNTVYGVAGEGEFDTGSKVHAKKEKEKEKEKEETGSRSEKRDAEPKENGARPHDGGAKLEENGHPKDGGDLQHTSEGGTKPSEDGLAGPQRSSTESKSPTDALARQFLKMTSHGTAGRLFTYVITLDGEWRFTETGAEFSIDLLSKHSMHANVAKEIAFSGEFFVRRLQREEEDRTAEQAESSPGEEPATNNLKDYELVIDNSSGTYQPKKELLPKLGEWLAREHNLGALGKVTAIDGFDETLKKWKTERQEEKRRAKGLKPKKGKGKEEDGGDEVGETGVVGKMAMPKRKGSSVSSISSGALGSGVGSVSSSDVEDIMKEDAKRARENDDDDDPSAQKEERVESGEAEHGDEKGKGKEAA